MLNLQQATLRRGTKTLIDKASFTLYPGYHVGLIGKNGCGKSSLLSVILGQLSLDEGSLNCQKNITLSHLAQETPNSTETAIDYVLSGDKKAFDLLNQEKNLKDLSEKAISKLFEDIENINAYLAPVKAAKILSGLGFSESDNQKPVNAFSGGWQMRLNLAKCLMTPATLMLLDEPTNHLDLEACIWLEKYLKQLESSFILVSHDRSFLDAVCSHILNHHKGQLKLYTGNYSDFEKRLAEEISLQQKHYEKQQKHVAHLMKFVDKFRAKASKAKQAQSRLKAINKLEMVAKVQVDSPFSFHFDYEVLAKGHLITLEAANLGYDKAKPILHKADFQIAAGEKVALLGANGQGKSTFIKSLAGELALLNGDRNFNPQTLKIGYFAQHQLDKLTPGKSPIEHLFQIDEKISDKDARNFLGQFGFSNDDVFSDISPFSGGEKARLALALLCYQKPNLLLLDEPTNHFDIEMRQAIMLALQGYQGALILVTHDKFLIQNCIDSFYLIHQQKISPFDGSLEDYESLIINHSKKEKQNQKPEKNKVDNKEQKKTIQKIEKELEKSYAQLKKVDSQLALPEVYENKEKYLPLVKDQKVIQQAIEDLEEKWLLLQS